MIFQSLKIVISHLSLFSVVMLKYSDKEQLKGERANLSAHSSKLQSILVEKSKHQDLKVDGHIVSTVGRG